MKSSETCPGLSTYSTVLFRVYVKLQFMYTSLGKCGPAIVVVVSQRGFVESWGNEPDADSPDILGQCCDRYEEGMQRWCFQAAAIPSSRFKT